MPCCCVAPINQGICLINCGCKYTQTCIGNPSQAPGGNPATTTAPGSASTNPSFLSGLTGIALKSFAGIATQAEVSAQQRIALATNTSSISGWGTNVVLIIAALVALYFFTKK